MGDIFAHKKQVISDGGAEIREGVEVAFKLAAPRARPDADPGASPDAKKPEARCVRVVRCAEAATLDGVLLYLERLRRQSAGIAPTGAPASVSPSSMRQGDDRGACL